MPSVPLSMALCKYHYVFLLLRKFYGNITETEWMKRERWGENYHVLKILHLNKDNSKDTAFYADWFNFIKHKPV